MINQISSDNGLPPPGSLIRILTELFWYDRSSAKEQPEKLYYVIESMQGSDTVKQCEAETLNAGSRHLTDVLNINLIIDGSPTWVEVGKKDFDLCV